MGMESKTTHVRNLTESVALDIGCTKWNLLLAVHNLGISVFHERTKLAILVSEAFLCVNKRLHSAGLELTTYRL